MIWAAAADAAELHAPAAVAEASGPGLTGARVVDLVVAPDGALWAATLGGGVARWDGAWTTWHRGDGLPGDWAVAVDVGAHGTYVGTDRGLARLGDDGVARTWTTADGLPDDYTQAVAVDGDLVWAGTYRGLARVTAAGIDVVLSPWSCFSLLRGPDRRMWVGYDGLRGLPMGEPIEGVPDHWRIFDVEPQAKGAWLATDEHGLVWLDDGVTEAALRPRTGGVYAIARVGDVLWLAAAERGLLRATTDGRWAPYDGPLPSPVVNEVIPDGSGGVWVGTDRGVARVFADGRVETLPLAPLAAGAPVRDVAAGPRGAVALTERGPVWVGDRPPRGFARFAAEAAGATSVRFAGRDVVASDGPRAWRLRRGRVVATVEPAPDWRLDDGVVRHGARRWDALPAATDLAAAGDVAWVATASGLWRLTSDGGMDEIGRLGPLRAVAVAGDAVWAAGADGRLHGPVPAAPTDVDVDVVVENADVIALDADGDGVFVATTAGLFHVRR